MENQKVWFVTGASKGFGLALVKLLLDKGHQVAATSRNADAISSQFPQSDANLLALTVDITDTGSVDNAVRRTIERFQKIDVVVNNAGYMLLGSLEEVREQEFRASLEVNLFGTYNVIHAFMPYLRAQKSGHIINFSSLAGYFGSGCAGSYNAAKFAVIGLSEALAKEVKPLGINVTVVAPGLFRTRFLEKGSFLVAQNRIESYGTNQLALAMQDMDGKQPGDPQKLTAALFEISEMTNPPLHLLAGNDAYNKLLQTRKEELEEINYWKDITQKMDFQVRLDK